MKNGFTIVELIISIFILQAVIVGIFSAFSIVTILTSDTSDRLIGAYLAQEGLEIVRNIRDTNWLNMEANVPGAKWIDHFTEQSTIDSKNCTAAIGGCEMDYTTGTGAIGGWQWPQTFSGNILCLSPNGFYYYTTSCSSGSETSFMRRITIDHVQDVDDNFSHIIKVKTEVSWKKKASILGSELPANICNIGKNCILAEEVLYDWY